MWLIKTDVCDLIEEKLVIIESEGDFGKIYCPSRKEMGCYNIRCPLFYVKDINDPDYKGWECQFGKKIFIKKSTLAKKPRVPRSKKQSA